jgi:outer membrane assembly lipoprotein YfgL
VKTRLMLSVAALACAGLVACSSTPSRPEPTALSAFKAEFDIAQAWSFDLGSITGPLSATVHGQRIALASSAGRVVLLDGDKGQVVWQLQLDAPVQAGVGGDGERFAVVNNRNEVLTLQAGKVLWKRALPASTLTVPLVAGGRVFVMTADRAVTALDGATGRELWRYEHRASDALVLRQAGLLMPVGNTLIAGLGGRMLAIDPDQGRVQWEVAVGSVRGTNEVERLVDLVNQAARDGQTVCARAFQSAVACVDTATARTLWSKPAQGHQGLGMDATHVYAVESDGKVQSLSRADGQTGWTNDSLRFRGLTAPLVLGRSVVVGDAQGYVHFLSRKDGHVLQRLSTDGSAIAMAPVQVGQTLVVVTRQGQVRAFKAQ